MKMKAKPYYLFSAEYFSKYADTYDRQERCRSLCLIWIKERMMEQVNKEGTFLDIGTGTGYLPSEILKKHPHSFVVGIDVSKKMAKIARRKLPSERLQFIVAPAERMPFKNGKFDFVLSLFAWEHVSSQKEVMQRIYDILKPGGKFILGTNFKSDRSFNEKMRRFRKENATLADNLWKDWKKTVDRIKEASGGEYHSQHPRHHEQTYSKIVGQMEKAGFSDVKMLPTFLRIFGVFVGTKAYK